jgi:predicted Fe-S protein YdhL (DUF1289 family)
VLELYTCTTEEQRSVLRLLRKRIQYKDIRKEMFPVYGGKCLSRNAVYKGDDKFCQGCSKVADDETGAQKWLRQQSKDSHSAGFDALVMQCDKCINVFSSFEYPTF